MVSYSATRWWSKWELMKQMMIQFGEIEPFLNQNTDLGPSSRPRLLAILTNPEKLKHLKLELASVIDLGEFFVKATYNLEGDGQLAFTCYEEVQNIIAAIRVAHTHLTLRLLYEVFQHKLLYSRDCVFMLKAVYKKPLSIFSIN